MATVEPDKINKIVELVVSKKFASKNLWYGERETFPNDPGEDYVEPRKEFKNAFTDFVVNEFIQSYEQQAAFLKTVYWHFEESIKQYKRMKKLAENDVVFVYKGGNIMRFVAKSTNRELPGNVSDNLDYYKDYFKKSDADFNIFINPDLSNFYEIYEDMTQLSYLVQNHIRNIFTKNPEQYFEFYRIDDHERQKLLKKLLDKLNSTETVKNKLYEFDGEFTAVMFKNISHPEGAIGEEDRFDPRRDFEFIYSGDTVVDGLNVTDKKLIHLLPIHLMTEQVPGYAPLVDIIDEQNDAYKNTRFSEMYVSINRTTTFKKGGRIMAFNLVRTKMAFYGKFKHATGDEKWIKLDGELIDIGISDKVDKYIPKFFKRLDKNVTEYTVGEPFNFTFRGLSLEYLIEDLEKILYWDSNYPWEQPKSAKRIRRVLFLGFIALVSKTNISDETRRQYIGMLTKVTNDLNNKITGPSSITKENLEPEIRFLHDFLTTTDKVFVDRHGKEEYHNVKAFPFRNSIKGMSNLLIKLLTNQINVEYDKTKEYFEVVADNFKILNQSALDLSKYVKVYRGAIPEERFYKSDHVGGGYRLSKDLEFLIQ